MGMLRVMAAASPPSARSHFAPGASPASSSTVASGTPVHSQQLRRPWVNCTVLPRGSFHSVEPLPAHSRKWKRETEGNRTRSSMVKRRGGFTRPCKTRRWASGAMSGTPPWCRSKTRPLGVTMPSRSWRGVKLHDEYCVGVRSVGRRSTSPSCGEGRPYSGERMGLPSLRIVSGTPSGAPPSPRATSEPEATAVPAARAVLFSQLRRPSRGVEPSSPPAARPREAFGTMGVSSCAHLDHRRVARQGAERRVRSRHPNVDGRAGGNGTAAVQPLYRGSFVIDTQEHADVIGVHFRPAGSGMKVQVRAETAEGDVRRHAPRYVHTIRRVSLPLLLLAQRELLRGSDAPRYCAHIRSGAARVTF